MTNLRRPMLPEKPGGTAPWPPTLSGLPNHVRSEPRAARTRFPREGPMLHTLLLRAALAAGQLAPATSPPAEAAGPVVRPRIAGVRPAGEFIAMPTSGTPPRPPAAQSAETGNETGSQYQGSPSEMKCR